MKLSLRNRILVAMLVGAILANLIVSLSIHQAFEDPDSFPFEVQSADMAECTANPQGWSQKMLHMGDVWAYSLQGISQNPLAPPLDAELVRQVLAQGFAMSDYSNARLQLRRVADDGPCALMRIEFRPPFSPPQIGGWLAFGTALALVMVSALALLFVFQPLLTRISRIRRLAERVGAPDFVPAQDEVPDALGRISEVLLSSHTRIMDNEAELHQKRVALERHLAEIAHDLRTPLASLLLAVQELGESHMDPAVQRALDDVEYVNALVDNLHQGTRLKAGLEGREGKVDLVELTERLGARFGALGVLSKVDVAVATPEIPVWTGGSPALVERAIANLVHNAVRHNRGNKSEDAWGHVAVVLEVVGEAFVLRVEDDGPGLREDDLANLHEVTFLSETARRRGGGLGVAITNAIGTKLGWGIRYVQEGGLRVEIRGKVI